MSPSLLHCRSCCLPPERPHANVSSPFCFTAEDGYLQAVPLPPSAHLQRCVPHSAESRVLLFHRPAVYKIVATHMVPGSVRQRSSPRDMMSPLTFVTAATHWVCVKMVTFTLPLGTELKRKLSIVLVLVSLTKSVSLTYFNTVFSLSNAFLLALNVCIAQQVNVAVYLDFSHSQLQRLSERLYI